MEQYNGKWRFTSPTHVVRAFHQALCEPKAEGGVTARHARYSENQSLLGFEPLLQEQWQAPIIPISLAGAIGQLFPTKPLVDLLAKPPS